MVQPVIEEMSVAKIEENVEANFFTNKVKRLGDAIPDTRA